jgi:hypothetical protein
MGSTGGDMKKRRKKQIPKGVHPLIVKYRARLDAAWRKAVYEAGGGKCFISGETEMVNAHHIIDRRCYTSRWEVDNGVLLSPSNHKWSPSVGIHNNPMYILQVLACRRGDYWGIKMHRLAYGAKSIGELTMDEQCGIVMKALKELRPDLYAKEVF